MRRETGDLTRLVWDLSYVVVGAVVAAALAWPIYQSGRMLVIAAVATVLGIAIVLVGARLRWAAWVTALATVGAYLVLVVPLAIPSALVSPIRILRGLGDGVVGVVVGWKQILTLTVPLGEYQAVLVPFFVVMLVGTLAATLFALRGGRFSTAAVPVVLAMSLFGLVFGSLDTGRALPLGFTAVPAPREVLLSVLIVMVSLVWLVGRARMQRLRALRIVRASTDGVRQGAHSPWIAVRRQALGAILVVGAVLVGLAVAPAAAGWSDREALREAVDPVLVLQKQTSPLGAYRSWFEDDRFDEKLFTVTGDTSGIDRVRIATLGRYDGEVFRAGNESGDQVFARLPAATASDGVRLTVTIGDGFSGVWVPVPGTLDSAPDFTGSRADELTDSFYVSDADAAAVDVAVRADGGYGLAAGDSYRIEVQPPADDASLGSDQGGQPLVSENDYPEMADWVESQQVPRTGTGLAELITRIRERGYLSHALVDSEASLSWISALKTQADYVFQSSYAGHSVGRVETLFTEMNTQQGISGLDVPDELLVSAVGDDEQFATAAALLARYFGFESRVVVGARLSTDEQAPSVAPCDDGVCTGANVTAWVEVLSPASQWVPIDVSPQFAVVPIDVTEGEQLPENPTVPQEARTDVLDPPPAQRDDSTGTDPDDKVDDGWWAALLPILAAVGTGVLALLLLLLPLIFLVAIKSTRRRRRRNEPIPEVSVVGAWDELVDTYTDFAIDVPDSANRQIVAEAVGRPSALALANTVDAAVFAEHPPTRESSDAAWALLDDERADLAESSTVIGRIKAAVNLGSFFRHFTPRSVITAVLARFTPKESAR